MSPADRNVMNALAIIAMAPLGLILILFGLGFGGGGVTDLLMAAFVLRSFYVWMLVFGALSLLRVRWYRQRVADPLPRATRILMKILLGLTVVPVLLVGTMFLYLRA